MINLFARLWKHSCRFKCLRAQEIESSLLLVTHFFQNRFSGAAHSAGSSIGGWRRSSSSNVVKRLIRVLQSLIIQHKALNDELPQALGRPDAKSGGDMALHAVAHRDNHVQVSSPTDAGPPGYPPGELTSIPCEFPPEPTHLPHKCFEYAGLCSVWSSERARR